MALTDDTYFEVYNYVPNIKEYDPNNRTQNTLSDTIVDAENEVLSVAFGIQMLNDFSKYVLPNGGFMESIPDDAPQDEKDRFEAYKKIVFGEEYTKDNQYCQWKGLLEVNPKRSLLADYVYSVYLTDNVTQTTSIGENKGEHKIGSTASSVPKITKAYNKFVERFNGGLIGQVSGFTQEGNPFWFIGNRGVDYYGIDPKYGLVPLLQYLKDRESDLPYLKTNPFAYEVGIKNSFGL